MASVYLDSCVFIAAFESNLAVSQDARRLFDYLANLQTPIAVTSELTIAELLAPTKRPGTFSFDAKQSLYLDLLDNGGFIDVLPLSRSILVDTAKQRAHYPHRLPDAIHVASAVSIDCRFFVSYDRDARRLPPPMVWVTPTARDIDDLLIALDA